MSETPPQLEYSLWKPSKVARQAPIVLYVFAVVVICSAGWSTYNLLEHLNSAAVGRVNWSQPQRYNISGFKFRATLVELFQVAMVLISLHVAAGIVFWITGRRIAKQSAVWPWVSFVVAIPIGLIHLSDLQAGHGAALVDALRNGLDWTSIRLLIYTAFHGCVIVLVLAVLVMVILLAIRRGNENRLSN